MDNLNKDYLDLISLTKQYIEQHYIEEYSLTTTLEVANSFKEYKKQATQSLQATSQPEKPLSRYSKPPASFPLGLPTPSKKEIDSKIPTPILPKEPHSTLQAAIEKPIANPVNHSSTIKLPPASKESQDSRLFRLELQPPVQPYSFAEVRNIIAQALPDLDITDKILNDAIAKQINSAWQYSIQIPEIVILFHSESAREQNLLSNLTQALDFYVSSTKFMAGYGIEKMNDWPKLLKAKNLKLIICSKKTLYSFPKLLTYYREEQVAGLCYLQDTPLLMIPDLKVYFAHPSLKGTLWTAILNYLGEKVDV